jgi:hypothetical protein
MMTKDEMLNFADSRKMTESKGEKFISKFGCHNNGDTKFFRRQQWPTHPDL